MSTGLECEFIEKAPNKWYYTLQDGNCPVQTWDWHDSSTTYGPFTTFDLAQTHLHNNHANPGGYSVQDFKE